MMSQRPDLTLISPAIRDAMEHWLSHERALKTAADNTLSAYATDVAGFTAFMAQHRGGRQGLSSLAAIATRDMRAWMAHERGRGVSSRSLARSLSAVKTFFRWLAERHALAPTAVLSARAPKFERKLPRPLTEDAAHEMIETVEMQAQEDWIAARDAAVLTLLYGCGLRISEALGLTGADHPLPDVLRITGKGGKQRLVPVLPVARAAVSGMWSSAPLTSEQRIRSFEESAAGHWGQEWFKNPCAWLGCNWVCRQVPPPTPCATPLPHICSAPAVTCAPSKSCWAMLRSRPRKPIPRLTAGD